MFISLFDSSSESVYKCKIYSFANTEDLITHTVKKNICIK